MSFSSIKVLISLIPFLFSGCFSPVEELGEKAERSIVKRAPDTLRLIASYNHQSGIPPSRLENIAIGPQGQVYLRTQNTAAATAATMHSDVALFRTDAQGVLVTSVRVRMAGYFGAPLIVAPNGNVLAATSQGVMIIQNQNNNLIVSPQMLSSMAVTGIGFDSQGHLYVARRGEGIDIYDGGLPANLQNAHPNRQIGIEGTYTHLTAGVNGRMYATIGRDRNFVIIDGGNQIVPRGFLPFVADGEVTGMVFDHANSRLIAGTTDGVYILDEDGGVIEQYSRAEPSAQRLVSNRVLAVEVSSNGRIILVGFGDSSGAIEANEAGLTVIVDGIARDHYTPQQLGFSDPTTSIYTIRRIDGGRFYIGSSNGELALVELNIELRGEGQANNANPRRDEHPHRIIARKSADRHSSILPHPPRIAIPQSLSSESWGHWFKKLGCGLLSFESGDPRRFMSSCAAERNPRSADRQNDQDSHN